MSTTAFLLRFSQHLIVRADAPGGSTTEEGHDQAAELVAGAERPLLWAGGGVVSADALLRHQCESCLGNLFTPNCCCHAFCHGALVNDHSLCRQENLSGFFSKVVSRYSRQDDPP